MKARKKSKTYVRSGSSAKSAEKSRQHSFRLFEQMKFLEASMQTEV